MTVEQNLHTIIGQFVLQIAGLQSAVQQLQEQVKQLTPPDPELTT